MRSLYTITFTNGDSYQWRGIATKTSEELVIYSSPKMITIPLGNILYWIKETQ